MKKRKFTIDLPLPMSVNKLYAYNKYTHQKVYKKEAMDYLKDWSAWIKIWMTESKVPMVKEMTYFDLDFYLPRTNSDSHNYKKLLFDLLEWGGMVENDKYIMDRTQSIKYDPKKPRVIISWDV